MKEKRQTTSGASKANSTGSSLQTLDRAMELLTTLANSPSPLSVIELSRQIGVNRTTIYAMLNSLLNGRYVHKDHATGKYIIGYKLFELGQLFRQRFPFLRIAQIYAFQLMKKWNLSVYVAIYAESGEVLALTDEYPVGVRLLYEGAKGPATATAIGKVLLAGLSDEVLKKELDSIHFTGYTPNTITRRKQFEAVLNEVRLQGYAVDNQEYIMGMSCIAAPIKDRSGITLAAISISGEAEKIMPNRKKLIKDIMITARSISNN